MKACGFRSMSVTVAMLAASVAIMAASATRMLVSAPRGVMIAIVDPHRATPERAALRDEIVASLKSDLESACDHQMAVRSVVVGPRDAKLKLAGGQFDAALVIGDDRPFALRRIDLVTLAGTVPASNGLQSVSLIMADGDPALTQRLRNAFGRFIGRQQQPAAAASMPSRNLGLATIGG